MISLKKALAKSLFSSCLGGKVSSLLVWKEVSSVLGVKVYVLHWCLTCKIAKLNDPSISCPQTLSLCIRFMALWMRQVIRPSIFFRPCWVICSVLIELLLVSCLILWRSRLLVWHLSMLTPLKRMLDLDISRSYLQYLLRERGREGIYAH